MGVPPWEGGAPADRARGARRRDRGRRRLAPRRRGRRRGAGARDAEAARRQPRTSPRSQDVLERAKDAKKARKAKAKAQVAESAGAAADPEPERRGRRRQPARGREGPAHQHRPGPQRRQHGGLREPRPARDAGAHRPGHPPRQPALRHERHRHVRRLRGARLQLRRRHAAAQDPRGGGREGDADADLGSLDGPVHLAARRDRQQGRGRDLDPRRRRRRGPRLPRHLPDRGAARLHGRHRAAVVQARRGDAQRDAHDGPARLHLHRRATASTRASTSSA